MECIGYTTWLRQQSFDYKWKKFSGGFFQWSFSSSFMWLCASPRIINAQCKQSEKRERGEYWGLRVAPLFYNTSSESADSEWIQRTHDARSPVTVRLSLFPPASAASAVFLALSCMATAPQQHQTAMTACHIGECWRMTQKKASFTCFQFVAIGQNTKLSYLTEGG